MSSCVPGLLAPQESRGAYRADYVPQFRGDLRRVRRSRGTVNCMNLRFMHLLVLAQLCVAWQHE